MEPKKLSINKTRLLELNRKQFEPGRRPHASQYSDPCHTPGPTSLILCHTKFGVRVAPAAGQSL